MRCGKRGRRAGFARKDRRNGMSIAMCVDVCARMCMDMCADMCAGMRRATAQPCLSSNRNAWCQYMRMERDALLRARDCQHGTHVPDAHQWNDAHDLRSVPRRRAIAGVLGALPADAAFEQARYHRHVPRCVRKGLCTLLHSSQLTRPVLAPKSFTAPCG